MLCTHLIKSNNKNGIKLKVLVLNLSGLTYANLLMNGIGTKGVQKNELCAPMKPFGQFVATKLQHWLNGCITLY